MQQETKQNIYQNLVDILQAMLDGRLSFFEGAAQIVWIKNQLPDIPDRDKDFDVFVVIESESDHLPLQSQRHSWSSEALKNLQPEYERTEDWAKEFAPQACRNLITRFGKS